MSPLSSESEKSVLPGKVMGAVIENFGKLSKVQRMELLNCLFRMSIEMDYSKELSYFVPQDLLSLLFLGIQHLHEKDKENVIYHLCKCLSEKREDGSSARLNVDMMPFGLLAYNCKFFATDDPSNLRASEDYKKWMESMYCFYGNSWASLFLGPMWSYEEDKDASQDVVTEAVVNAFGQLTIPDVDSACSVSPGNDAAPVTSPVAASTASVATCTTSWMPSSASARGSEGQSALPQHISTLWSALSPTERDELEESEVPLRDIAAMHQLTPPESRPHRSLARKTMNVSFNFCEQFNQYQLSTIYSFRGYTKGTTGLSYCICS